MHEKEWSWIADAGGLGGRNEPVACAAGGSAAATRDGRKQGSRR